MDEGARDGDHAWVRVPTSYHFQYFNGASRPMPHTRWFCGDAEFMRSIGQHYDASVTRVFPLFVATFQCLVTSHPLFLDNYAQMQGVGVAMGNLMPYKQGHCLDSIMEMVMTAAGETVSNVVGMTGDWC
jgi:hypothetical protein